MLRSQPACGASTRGTHRPDTAKLLSLQPPETGAGAQHLGSALEPLDQAPVPRGINWILLPRDCNLEAQWSLNHLFTLMVRSLLVSDSSEAVSVNWEQRSSCDQGDCPQHHAALSPDLTTLCNCRTDPPPRATLEL